MLPKLDSYVYASENKVIASIFATARAEQEDQPALVIAFKPAGDWTVDPAFPLSVRSKTPVHPQNIVSMELLNIKQQLDSEGFLKALKSGESISL